MQRKLKALKDLAKLYRLRENGARYFQNESAASKEELPTSRAALKRAVENCHLCELSKRRNQAFFGSGSGTSGVMIVLEEPNAHEDKECRWYAGPGGEMARNIVEKALGLNAETVYLTAAIKCHSAGSRGDYALKCKAFLGAEIEMIQPKIVIAMGGAAFFALTGSEEEIIAARGKLWQCAFSKCYVAPTYSLNFLRHNVSLKKEAMADFKFAMSALGR
ncbi:MAG: uracil-DNA glycosylase [Helicobacteraceae bacterium]|jgi:DNA polymerase|nr:uracil-DNA glycosylase [Helicobacteraceae bacterium]